jgi:hypothetical protein
MGHMLNLLGQITLFFLFAVCISNGVLFVFSRGREGGGLTRHRSLQY